MTLPASEKLKSRRWPFVALLLLALSFVVIQRYGNDLLMLVTDPTEVTRVTPPPCNLNRSPCQLPVITPVASEAPWTFSITPRPIPVSAPLTFKLSPPERILYMPTAAWVDLTGDDMDMGLIRVTLTPEADGSWTGTGSIPVCITGAMRWRARLNLQLTNTVLQADWVFVAPDQNARH